MIAVPLSVLNTRASDDLKPTHHMYYGQRIVDVNDGGWFTQIFKIQGRALDARKRRDDVTTKPNKPKPASKPKPRAKRRAKRRSGAVIRRRSARAPSGIRATRTERAR